MGEIIAKLDRPTRTGVVSASRDLVLRRPSMTTPDGRTPLGRIRLIGQDEPRQDKSDGDQRDSEQTRESADANRRPRDSREKPDEDDRNWKILRAFT